MKEKVINLYSISVRKNSLAVFFIAFKHSSQFLLYHYYLFVRLYPSATIIQVEVGLRQERKEKREM